MLRIVGFLLIKLIWMILVFLIFNELIFSFMCRFDCFLRYIVEDILNLVY